MIERIDVTQESTNSVYLKFCSEHMIRYKIARRWITREFRGRKNIPDVADVACGDGYGYEILKDVCNYDGHDIDGDAIRTARIRHNGRFHVSNAMSFGPGPFDCVVSLETAEHLDDPIGFFRHVHGQLHHEGVFIVSAPTCLTMDFDPFHKRDWSSTQWRDALIDSGFLVQEVMPMPFVARFTDFIHTVPTTWNQKARVIQFLLGHPKYLCDRIWNWACLNRFYWESTIFLCRKITAGESHETSPR